MDTLKRGCTGSIIVSGATVGAAVVASGMNLWRVCVGAAVGAIGAAAVGAVVGAVVGAIVAAIVGAMVGAAVGAIVGAAVGAIVGAAVVAAGVVSSSSSPPQATITMAINATIDSRPNICHLLSHLGDFTYTPPVYPS
jgi:phage tail tape-measure protein